MYTFHIKHIQALIAALIIAVTAAGAVMWNIYTPVTADDWCYLRKPLADSADSGDFWQCRGEIIHTFSDAIDASVTHYTVVNGRLANILHYLFQPLGTSNSFEDIFCGLAIAVMTVLIAMTARNTARPGLHAIIWATLLSWIVLPWYDGMQSSVYQANYVWTTILICTVIMLVDRLRGMKTAAFAATLAVAFIAGTMHEGFTVVLLVYLTALAFTGKASKRLAAVIGVVAAAFLSQLAGGIVSRAVHQPGLFEISLIRYALSRIIFSLWPLALAAIAIAAEKAVTKISWRELYNRYGALSAAAVAAAAMPTILMQFDRVFWPMDLFCIIIIVSGVSRVCDKMKPAFTIVIGAAFTLLYAAWFAGLVRVEKRFADEYVASLDYLGEISSPRVPFRSVIPLNAMPTDSIPWYYFDIANQPLESNGNTARMGATFGAADDYVMPTAPEYALKPFERWPRVPGNNDLRGEWPFLAANDSINRTYAVTFGKPDGNMPPYDRLLCKLYGRSGEATHNIIWWPRQITTESQDTLWQVFIDRLPRTLRHRRCIRIDTIPQYAAEPQQ